MTNDVQNESNWTPKVVKNYLLMFSDGFNATKLLTVIFTLVKVDVVENWMCAINEANILHFYSIRPAPNVRRTNMIFGKSMSFVPAIETSTHLLIYYLSIYSSSYFLSISLSAAVLVSVLFDNLASTSLHLLLLKSFMCKPVKTHMVWLLTSC